MSDVKRSSSHSIGCTCNAPEGSSIDCVSLMVKTEMCSKFPEVVIVSHKLLVVVSSCSIS